MPKCRLAQGTSEWAGQARAIRGASLRLRESGPPWVGLPLLLRLLFT